MTKIPPFLYNHHLHLPNTYPRRLNGVYLGHFTSGYVSFRYWLHNVSSPDAPNTPVLNYGGDNVLAVRADALSAQEGW